MNSFEQKLFDKLNKEGLIPEAKAQRIIENVRNTSGSLEAEFARRLNISSGDLLAAKSELSGLPPFDLVDEKEITQDVLREISEQAAIQYKIVPLGKIKRKLKVGIVNPEDYESREAVRFIALGGSFEPELYVITEEAFKKIIGRYTTLRGQIEEALTELERELKEERKVGVPSSGTPEIIREAPITKVVAVILKHAVEGGASDIHIEKGETHTNVRFRVHGKLYTSLLLPTRIHASVISRIKILSNLRLDESRIPQDGRFSASISGRNIDFRVSTFPTRAGEKAVMRVLDPSGAIHNFSELGLAGSSLHKLEAAIKKPFGMILISGPTGSGKSTTLYAALLAIDRKSYNVVSLEDPVEYYIEGVSQSQIRPEIGYTFASGLRHVLRQDPDIIMVGEIRDSETAQLATHASLTGHLVFSTIHTKNAIGVIPRLIDMGVEKFILPSALSLLVAQRLARRLCPNCKTPFVPPQKIADVVRKELSAIPKEELELHELVPGNLKLWKSPGCDKCSHTGTVGRIAIFEVFLVTDEVSRIIYEEANEPNLKKEAEKQGMITLKQDGIIKALKGLISIEELIRIAGK